MKYIFLHIPKTAGTALRQSLMGSFREKDTATCYRIGHVTEDLEAAVKEGKKLIIGHIDFSHLGEVEIPTEYKLLAMFRHHAERIISTYIHFQKHTNPAYSTWKGGEMEFKDFLKSEFANHYLLQLFSGKKGKIPEPAEQSELLKIAEQNLDKLSWVGITERFDDALFSLSQFMGRQLKHPGYYNEGGEAEKHRELRSKFRPEILLRNSSEILLYQIALKRFDQQLDQIKFRKIKRAWFNFRSRK